MSTEKPTRKYNAEANKRYYEKTKESRREARAEAYKRHRQNSPYVKCQCGTTLRKISLYTHVKSKNHLMFVNRCEADGVEYKLDYEILEEQPEKGYRGESPRVVCECGFICKQTNYVNHKRGLYHKNFINETYPDNLEKFDEDMYKFIDE